MMYNGTYLWRVSDYPSATPMSTVEAEPDEGRSADEWPYPTVTTTYLTGGVLAQDVRKKLGLDDDVPIIMVEDAISGGYSEYTQENDYYITLKYGSESKEFDGIAQLIQWLVP